jgi:hypothetical protein
MAANLTKMFNFKKVTIILKIFFYCAQQIQFSLCRPLRRCNTTRPSPVAPPLVSLIHTPSFGSQVFSQNLAYIK